MYLKERITPSLDAYANQVLEVIDVISPDCNECEDNWRAITFLMNAQYQEEFDKTTISGHTVPTAAAAQSNDIGIFSSESINTQETSTSKRKRTWDMSSKAMEEDSRDDFEGEVDRG